MQSLHLESIEVNLLVKTYDSLRNENGEFIKGLTKLFIRNYDDEGNLMDIMSGIACVPEGTGTMFIVDEWLIDQLDKVQFKDGRLSVKDGEKLIRPVKSEKELKIEELQRQMAELQAMPDEPAYTEEPTNELSE